MGCIDDYWKEDDTSNIETSTTRQFFEWFDEEAVHYLPFSNPQVHKTGFAIRTTQNGGCGSASTMTPALRVLNIATINRARH